MPADHSTPEGRRCPSGLPALPAADFVSEADSFQCPYCDERHPVPTPAPVGGEANRCVFENADGQRCILTYGHTEPHTAPTLAATGGEEVAERIAVFAFDLDGLGGLMADDQQRCRDMAEWHLRETDTLRRQLAEAEAGVARQDRKWMDAIRRIAGREICFSPGWAGHDHTKVPHPTLEQFVNELRERATTAERRLEEAKRECGEMLRAAVEGAAEEHERQFTASQQEVARLTEAHQQRERVWAERFALLDQQNARLRAVEEAARRMPRATPAAGAAGTEYQFTLTAATVWALDAALTELDKHRGALSTPQQGSPE